ncbi:class A beta-lactamase [Pseudonocardia acidicola]|uniref:Beta-lactamase n=1 Tax=Pseudonocardia acidicola TaxID=2724939 RepID=A0ABX1SKI2_9PSEU|nr:class A beta-lactamase [Pseudonocardia acidicola]NMI00907.1 class A beta-lactamase [Pseudonocardia acidicola]
MIDRRRLLTGLFAAPLVTACGAPAATPPVPPATTRPTPGPRFEDLERRYGARLGVYAVNATTSRFVAHRQDERFALCSTFKTYAAGALLHAHPRDSEFWSSIVRYSRSEIVSYSPVTEQHVETGMTAAQLCEAAITHSDNTAGNQLLKLLGGPPAIGAFAREIGDPATRLDRWETDLNSAIPGDDRDTTTPAAIAAGYRAMVLGTALGAAERGQLKDWLIANTTGAERIRAAVPPGWTTGDKTGSGSYGTANDIAVTWSPAGEALVIAILSGRTSADAVYDNALIAAAAGLVIDALR